MLRTRYFEFAPAACGHKKCAGYRPADAPASFYSGKGFLTAHDVIEHLSDNPDWNHELMAFGSTVFGRFHYDQETMLASYNDLGAFMEEHKWEVERPPAKFMKPLADRKAEKLIHALVDMSLGKTLQIQLMHSLFGKGWMASEPQIRDAYTRAAGWMRRGYLLAKRAYRGHTGAEVGRALFELADNIDDFAKAHDPEYGDRLKVTVDTRTLRTKLEVVKEAAFA